MVAESGVAESRVPFADLITVELTACPSGFTAMVKD